MVVPKLHTAGFPGTHNLDWNDVVSVEESRWDMFLIAALYVQVLVDNCTVRQLSAAHGLVFLCREG